MPKILIINDEVQINRFIARSLEKEKHSIANAYTLEQGQILLREESFDLVFLEINLPDGNGLDALGEFMNVSDAPEIIIITGSDDSAGAKYALETGVYDYLQKPLNLNNIRLACKRALEFREFRIRRRGGCLLKRHAIVGRHAKLETCLEKTARAAATDSSILITGETGTGKELIARAIHENSARADNNFIVVDCAALTTSLMESISFGHEKGAFTGADAKCDGLVFHAHRGTLFLDEVGELDHEEQKKFLRLLNNKSFYPLGSRTPLKSDFRLVAATNRDLETEMAENRFRQDLYFRLNGQSIHLPPLRERKEDLRELVHHYVKQICDRMHILPKKIYPEFIEALEEYDWPGNVRELINSLDASISSFPDDPCLQVRHLPTRLRVALCNGRMSSVPSASEQDSPELYIDSESEFPDWKTLKQNTINSLEEQYFKKLSARTGGRAKDMAELSGLTRARIYELFKKYPAFNCN
jgi:two-component system NtrC family response regulator